MPSVSGGTTPSLEVAAACQAPASVTEAHASPGYIPREMTSPFCPQALSNRGQHSISYTLSRSHSVIVEYTHDGDTDMFQVGSGAPTSLLATGHQAWMLSSAGTFAVCGCQAPWSAFRQGGFRPHCSPPRPLMPSETVSTLQAQLQGPSTLLLWPPQRP